MNSTARIAFSLLGSAALIAGLSVGAPAQTGGKTYSFALTGEAECNTSNTCNVGDPDGEGSATITVNTGQDRVCWEVEWSGILTPFGAHIHIGLEGTGPASNIVLPLSPIESGCATDVREDLLTALRDAPEAFYVNVHTSEFPGGAIRGQLDD